MKIQKNTMKILIFILIFFIISGLIIVNNYNLEISHKEDMKNFSKLYSNWFSQIYSNVFSITGHATKLNWFPE